MTQVFIFSELDRFELRNSTKRAEDIVLKINCGDWCSSRLVLRPQMYPTTESIIARVRCPSRPGNHFFSGNCRRYARDGKMLMNETAMI